MMFNIMVYVPMVLMLALHLCASENHSDVVTQARKEIRKEVLKDYDVVVGPLKITLTGDPFKVELAFTPTNLVDVNTKDQILKIDGWIVQRWTDEFVTWNITKYHDTKFCVFSPHEVWVPDIALKNNADRSEKLAGGKTKFKTDVFSFFDGQIRWVSPATFTSVCKQNVKEWPVDTQVCYLEFGSYTYDIRNFVVTAPDVDYKPGSVSNGEWILDDIQITNTKSDTLKCCGEYSIVKYKITLSRKPRFILLYLAPPSFVLVLLAMISFFIPIESGERIGFVTTILLTFMVFQLIVPSFLPKTSDQQPTLSILLTISMVLISWVLFVTIIIVWCYHREGTPSVTVKMLLFPLSYRKNRNNGVGGEREMESGGSVQPWVGNTELLNWKAVAAKFNKVAFFFTWICVLMVCLPLLLSI